MENEIEFSKASDEGNHKTGIHELDAFHSELEDRVDDAYDLEEEMESDELELDDESEFEESDDAEEIVPDSPEEELKELYKHKSNLPYDKLVERILALKGSK